MVRNMRWAAVAVVLGTASVAAAQSEEPAIDQVDEKVEQKVEAVRASAGAGAFGQANQLVVSGDFDMGLGYRTTDDKFWIQLSPSADYFFKENLSLGAGLELGTTLGDGPDLTRVGGNVRVGYNMPVAETLSFWPKLKTGLFHQNVSTLAAADTTAFQVSIEAPVLFHPASNFFIGAGPNLDIFLGDASGIDLGVRTVVGGYF